MPRAARKATAHYARRYPAAGRANIARYVEVDGEPCVLELVQDLQQDTPEAVVQRRQMLTQTGSMGEKLYRDALTGLYNRRYYEDALKNRSMEAGVAVLDMDGFKACNETYGHQAGDKMLEAAVGVMRHCVRRSDTIGTTHVAEAIQYRELDGKYWKG